MDDDILNQALNEFQEDRAVTANVRDASRRAVTAAASVSATTTRTSTAGSQIDRGAAGDSDVMARALGDLISEMQDPNFKRVLDDAVHEIRGDASRTADPAVEGTAGNIVGALAAGGNEAEETAALTTTLEMLQRLATEMESGGGIGDGGKTPTPAGDSHSSSGAATAELADGVMSRMMSEFERLGNAADFGGAVDGMMRQLLSRDLMYLPMQSIAEAYPAWLAANASKMPREEYEAAGHQFQLFQAIVALYETEPDNFPRLLELMQQLQETGQPPREIVAQLAPGLELTPEGLPALPGMFGGGAGGEGIGGMSSSGGGGAPPGGCIVC